MDSRDDLRKAPGKRQSRPNDIDQATIAKLNTGQQDPLRLRFANSDTTVSKEPAPEHAENPSSPPDRRERGEVNPVSLLRLALSSPQAATGTTARHCLSGRTQQREPGFAKKSHHWSKIRPPPACDRTPESCTDMKMRRAPGRNSTQGRPAPGDSPQRRAGLGLVASRSVRPTTPPHLAI
jgi:hypothetical protein